MKKILLVFTGGTICTVSRDGVRNLSTESAKYKIVKNYAKSGGKYSDIAHEIFETAHPINILSENSDKKSMSKLIAFFKTVNFSKYSGIIVLHGTDTLAYSCAMFSLLLKDTKIPVVFVSANAPLDDSNSNGNENFKFATEKILDKDIKNGVFAAYKNISDGKMHLHRGYAIMQSANFSDDFKSADVPCPEPKVTLKDVNGINAEILCISPYVGINYDLFDLKNVDAVLHKTYHSGTLESNSFSAFAKKCEKAGIPVYIAACKKEKDEVYASSLKIKSNNITFLNDMTAETAYCKLLTEYSAKKSTLI